MISDESIQALHQKYAQNLHSYELVFQHCQIVQAIALELADHYGGTVDREIVRVGALLHDIGSYGLFDGENELIAGKNYIQHGVVGEEILRAEGLSEAVCLIASHHTGTGITREDIEKKHLPLPLDDYMAQTVEQELVMYADKFHTKGWSERLLTYKKSRALVAGYGESDVVRFDKLHERFGEPHYIQICEVYRLQMF